jgi:hypothetical protein
MIDTMKWKLVLLALVAGVFLAGCEREHWEAGLENPVIMGPQDLLARLIVGGILAATEDAPKQEFRLTCQQIGYTPLFGRNETVRLRNFSVVSPSTGNWCIQRQDENRVSYGTHPLVGKTTDKRPTEGSLINTFILAAMRVSTRPGVVAEKGGALLFARAWIESGAEITLEGGEVIADFKTQSRFKLLRHELTERSIRGVDCLDYSYVVTERDNPIAPGKVFQLHAVGILCPDPAVPDVLIALNFSERFVQGAQVDEGAFESLLNGSAQPFFDSLSFPSDGVS